MKKLFAELYNELVNLIEIWRNRRLNEHQRRR